MFDQVFSSLNIAMSRVWLWFDQLFDAVPGSWAFVFATISIFLIVKFLLIPITGIAFRSGVSDKVRRSRRGQE